MRKRGDGDGERVRALARDRVTSVAARVCARADLIHALDELVDVVGLLLAVVSLDACLGWVELEGKQKLVCLLQTCKATARAGGESVSEE